MPHLSVSVIIPTYNRAPLIERAIHSALSQLQSGDEIIVVDDGSTDNTQAVVERISGPIRYVLTPNGGAGRARNVGLSHARGDLVAFLDSDDEWMPGKLAMQRALMAARPDVLFAFSNFAVTLKGGQPVHDYLINWLKEPMPWDVALAPAVPLSSIAAVPEGVADCAVHIGDLSAAEMVDNYVLTSSFIVRRVEAGDALQFAPDLKIFEDWYCFARLSLKGNAAYFDCETAWQHGLADDRVSDAGTLDRAEGWHVLNERIWSTEPEFLRRHASLYQQRLRRHRLNFARGLIGAGDTRRAREILAKEPNVPWPYRVLSHVPGAVIRPLAEARRRIVVPLQAPVTT
ncbi:MAG: glycosyltransferase family 2 protein [Planctomycetia bacterium]|nr:glycosyltransferase family 2 protein [Planctomycetia bacterium]